MLRLIAALLLLTLAACAARPRADTVTEELPWLALTPEAAPLMALEQRLHFERAGEKHTLDALLEVDATEMRLLLHAGGQPLLRIRWDGARIEQQRSEHLPPQVTAERVLNDLQLAHWPAEVVAAALPEGWTLDESDAGRVLRYRSHVVQRIRREDNGTILIEHLITGFRLRIESVALQP
ncbi:MAG TPA: DUF3261 domain-containing protein [Arenimonas sp.]|nr:DUF3261 domain-containing protein [Arenimonas sp.]